MLPARWLRPVTARRLVLHHELLEDRTRPSNIYDYDVIAETGSAIRTPKGADAGTLASMSLPSINDAGTVGFLGTSSDTGQNGVVEGVVGPDGSVGLYRLTDANTNF